MTEPSTSKWLVSTLPYNVAQIKFSDAIWEKHLEYMNKLQGLKEPTIIVKENLELSKRVLAELNDQEQEGKFVVRWNQRNEKIKCFAKFLIPSNEYHGNNNLNKELLNLTRIHEHENIATLYGVVIENPFIMISEYCEKNLHQHLTECELSDDQLLKYAIQIANGMEYMSSMWVIHGNLSAKKILLSDDEKVVKISDFGMVRIEMDANSWRVGEPFTLHENFPHNVDRCRSCLNQQLFQVWWWAPEVIHEIKHSQKSDVWSFGVTLWELYSQGNDPREIIYCTASGEYLPKPERCPDETYETMVKCWNIEPENRPNFSILQSLLQPEPYRHKIKPSPIRIIPRSALDLPIEDEFYDVKEPFLIEIENLEIYGELGKGNFGKVSGGIWKRSIGTPEPIGIKCAVKQLMRKFSTFAEQSEEEGRGEALNKSEEVHDEELKQYEEVRDEALNMLKLRQHENVVTLYGIVLKPEIMMVFEFCDGGSLEKRLKNKSPSLQLKEEKLKDYAIQIATGMEYLCKMGFVHRDLAARNVMLTNNEKLAKVGDFGLTRFKNLEGNIDAKGPYFKPGAKSNTQLHLNYCAPEVFGEHKVYTEKSDVWSYGVLLWEMFSKGRNPPEMAFMIVKEIIKARGTSESYKSRLKKPKDCPDVIYELMKKCWDEEPKNRPNFETIKREEALRYKTSNPIVTYVAGTTYIVEMDNATFAFIYNETGESLPYFHNFTKSLDFCIYVSTYGQYRLVDKEIKMNKVSIKILDNSFEVFNFDHYCSAVIGPMRRILFQLDKPPKIMPIRRLRPFDIVFYNTLLGIPYDMLEILKITRARKVILMCCDDKLDDSDYFPINMKNLSLVAEKLTTPSYGFLLDQLVLNHPNRELPNMFMNLIKGKNFLYELEKLCYGNGFLIDDFVLIKCNERKEMEMNRKSPWLCPLQMSPDFIEFKQDRRSWK